MYLCYIYQICKTMVPVVYYVGAIWLRGRLPPKCHCKKKSCKSSLWVTASCDTIAVCISWAHEWSLGIIKRLIIQTTNIGYNLWDIHRTLAGRRTTDFQVNGRKNTIECNVLLLYQKYESKSESTQQIKEGHRIQD